MTYGVASPFGDDKHVIDLRLPEIIMNYGGWATLAKAFVIVK